MGYSHQAQDSPVCICPMRPTQHHCAALEEEKSAPWGMGENCSNFYLANPLVAEVDTTHHR